MLSGNSAMARFFQGAGLTPQSSLTETGFTMRHILGLICQFITLTLLPSIVIFQLFFGFRLIVMPISLLCGVILFSLGTWLRESR